MITEAQRKFRQNRIGGSDIAAIRGLSPFAGALSVQQRLNGIYEASYGDKPYNPVFEFGNRLESLILEVFAGNHPELLVLTLEEAYQSGLLARLPGFCGKVNVLCDGSVSLTHAEYDYLVMNIDSIYVHRNNPSNWGVLEIKTASEHMESDWGITGTDDVPIYHRGQPIYYAGGIGAPGIKLAAMIGLRDYREYSIDYTDSEFNEILSDVVGFYARHIVFGQPVVDLVDAKRGNAIVNSAAGARVADDTVIKVLLARKDLDLQMAPLKEARTALDVKVRAFMGDAQSLVDSNGEVLYMVNESSTVSLDENALKRQYPELYSRFLLNKPTRRHRAGSAYKSLNTSAAGRAAHVA